MRLQSNFHVTCTKPVLESNLVPAFKTLPLHIVAGGPVYTVKKQLYNYVVSDIKIW